MSGSTSREFETTSALDPQFQQPIADILGSQISGALRGPLPFFPGFDNVPEVFDPDVTEQFFQDVFAAPALRQLSGPGGTLGRIGAQAAQRGTFFSSGRQQQQANAAGQTFAGLGQIRAGLAGEDLAARQQEFFRRDPLTGPIGQQALNFLGTPMLAAFDPGPNPFTKAYLDVIGASDSVASGFA